MEIHRVGEPQLNLEQVKSHFDNWRNTRKKMGKIPEELWKEAVSLISKHNSTIIYKTLGLSPADFKKKVEYYQNTAFSISSQSFVEVSLESQSKQPTDNLPRIMIQGKNDYQMILEGFQAENLDLPSLIESFLRGSDVTD